MRRQALAAVLIFMGPAAGAQDATLKATQGRVFIRAAGQKIYFRAKAPDALIFGDSVKTGPKSLAQLVLEGGAIVLVRENSTLTLGGEPEDALVSFWIGEFLVGLKEKLGGKRSLKVQTPAAVASVRGTLFWGETDAAREATFAGFGSEVTVTAQGQSVTLKPGESVAVAYGKPPPKPKPHAIKRGYLKTFSVEGSLQGLEALVDPKIP